METAFWNERWIRGETGFHQSQVNSYLSYYYGHTGPPPEKRTKLRVFVPLSGKSVDMHWLVQNGYAVIGVECSQIAVEQFFIEQGLEHSRVSSGQYIKYRDSSQRLEILQGDYFQLQSDDLGEFTDVFDRASLIAMPQAMRADYVKKMNMLQRPGVRTLLITLSYPPQEMDGPPFSVGEDEVHELYGHNYKIETLCQKNIIDDEPRFKQRGLSSLTETAYKLTYK